MRGFHFKKIPLREFIKHSIDVLDLNEIESDGLASYVIPLCNGNLLKIEGTTRTILGDYPGEQDYDIADYPEFYLGIPENCNGTGHA